MNPLNHFLKTLNYVLRAFGYYDLHDFSTTVFKICYSDHLKITLPIIISLGTIREFVEDSIGLNVAAIAAFVWLCIAEFQTGLKAALKKKNQRVQSRKIGRMILKIGVYVQILWVLNSFSSNVANREIIGFEINPFGWLYYIVLVGIIFQLVISYLENLSALGYAELNGALGAVLRKYNKWFEFDGTKDGDNFENQI